VIVELHRIQVSRGIQVLRAQLDPKLPLPDTIVFDLSESRKGYRLNKMCNSLIVEENRHAYVSDEEAYMAKYDLSENVKELVRARDWAGLTEVGGNIYFLLKLGFVVQHGLYRMGAQMRGESFEAFLHSRGGKGAR
jgi:protocatechuate 4,5-dioxygenase alpha subunit